MVRDLRDALTKNHFAQALARPLRWTFSQGRQNKSGTCKRRSRNQEPPLGRQADTDGACPAETRRSWQRVSDRTPAFRDQRGGSRGGCESSSKRLDCRERGRGDAETVPGFGGGG